MSMVIGKEAREALLELSQDPGRLTFFEYEDQVKTILELCTDAPEVGLPDVNWSFVEEALREYAYALTDGGLDGAGRSLPTDIVGYADEIARWLESAGQEKNNE